jgi:hypothetical protein
MCKHGCGRVGEGDGWSIRRADMGPDVLLARRGV